MLNICVLAVVLWHPEGWEMLDVGFRMWNFGFQNRFALWVTTWAIS